VLGREQEETQYIERKRSKEYTPRDYTADNLGEYVPMLCVDCRGLEPTAFFPMRNEFVVVSAGGAEFAEDIDLSEGEWGNYNADNDALVSMSDIEFKWEAI
jgi:hypothetical protein